MLVPDLDERDPPVVDGSRSKVVNKRGPKESDVPPARKGVGIE